MTKTYTFLILARMLADNIRDSKENTGQFVESSPFSARGWGKEGGGGGHSL